jgi:predicted membrane channel-forming protein YqfA (hemolysin III family)
MLGASAALNGLAVAGMAYEFIPDHIQRLYVVVFLVLGLFAVLDYAGRLPEGGDA